MGENTEQNLDVDFLLAKIGVLEDDKNWYKTKWEKMCSRISQQRMQVLRLEQTIARINEINDRSIEILADIERKNVSTE